MKENKLIKILIPVIAVIVVFESIVLVSNLNKSPTNTNELVEENEILEQEDVVEPVADFIWETDSLEMKVGKTYNITLNLLSKQDLVLDSVETHVYFDPKMATVSKLVTNKEIGEELKSAGVDNKTGLIESILWYGEEKGVGFKSKKEDTVKVLSFMVTPKLEGKLDFDLSTSMTDTKLATIIVDTNTGKALAYLSNKLEINVTK